MTIAIDMKLSRPRVLIVDDEHSIRDCLESSLKADGCEVAIAPDALRAFDHAVSLLPDPVCPNISLTMPSVHNRTGCIVCPSHGSFLSTTHSDATKPCISR